MSRLFGRFGPALVLVAAVFSCFAFSTEQASAKQTIKLGFIGPVSGANALEGKGAKNAFLLAIRQANKNGYPYKVVPMALDDASKPSVGVAAALKIVNDPKAVAAIGEWNSPVALATTPVFQRAQMPFIVWGAISPKITEQNFLMVTRVTPTLAQENKPLAKWLVKGLGYDRIAILTTTDDYGQNDLKSFKKFATQDGAKIVGVASLPPDTANYKPALIKLKNKNPDVLYFGGVIGPAGLARGQMQDVGMNIPMAGISGIYDPKLIKLAGEKAAEGTLATSPIVQQNPKLEAYRKAYEKADFKYPHGNYGKYAYDATKILLHVIRKHGIDDPVELAHAIRNIHYNGVLGLTTFDKNGQTQVKIQTQHYVVQDGKWIPYSQSRYAKKN